jgi:hypothetical protein
MTPTTRVPGRVLAWTALLVALGASVGANVAFARPTSGRGCRPPRRPCWSSSRPVCWSAYR